MATARTIVTDATKKLGVWQKGKDLDADEADDGLRLLNGLIEMWNNEYLMIYQIKQLTHTLVAGTAQYTMGSGGDISTRPLRIHTAYVRDSDGNDFWMKQINNEEWSSITLKSTANTYPSYYYYRPNFPLGELNLHEAPQSNLTLYLEVWDQISSFTSLDTSASLPPAYEYALTFNLTKIWAPDFQVQPSPIVLEQAQNSKAMIKDVNNTQIPVLINPFCRQDYQYGNISTISTILG